MVAAGNVCRAKSGGYACLQVDNRQLQLSESAGNHSDRDLASHPCCCQRATAETAAVVCRCPSLHLTRSDTVMLCILCHFHSPLALTLPECVCSAGLTSCPPSCCQWAASKKAARVCTQHTQER